jgi:hypothetical protein
MTYQHASMPAFEVVMLNGKYLVEPGAQAFETAAEALAELDKKIKSKRLEGILS